MARHNGFNRRTVMLGLAAAATGSMARAADSDSPIAHGILADNELAKAFEKAPRNLPDITLIGLEGEVAIAEVLKGRTVLMPLWAEWCPPCLSEIPDFAKLQAKYGGDKFAVIPVLTGTRKQLTPDWIAHLFKILHAEALPPYIEKRFGSRLFETMCKKDRHLTLPCNLLIAPDGTVVGREIGRVTADDASEGEAPEKTKDAETVTRAIHGQTQSVWGKEPGEEFARAMANGFLG